MELNINLSLYMNTHDMTQPMLSVSVGTEKNQPLQFIMKHLSVL